MSRGIDERDRTTLARLEEAMWRPETRYERAFQEAHFAADFVEFGRSGRIHARAQVIRTDRTELRARLPLPNLEVRLLTTDAAQVTYDSEVEFEGVVEFARRSSLWTRTPAGWVMRFHQGTPYEPDARPPLPSVAAGRPCPRPAAAPTAGAPAWELREAGLRITRHWSDDDLVELRVEVGDGTSSFVNEVYASRGALDEAVGSLRTLAGELRGGRYDLGFGEFGPEYAGGAFRARLHFAVPGRLFVTCEQESELTEFGAEAVASRATMHLRSEPALLDRFVRELAALAAGTRGTAVLEGT